MDHQEGDQRLNQRIAIIGAGAAGLSAAHALRAKGYTNIVIFERADRVGGKCCTVEINQRNYELGAGIVAEDNAVVLQIAKEFGVELERVVFGRSSLIDGDTGETLPKRNVRGMMALIKEMIAYRSLCRKYSKAGEPGLTCGNPDLAMPFAEFARSHNIENLAREFALFFTGFGYDYLERVPAVYVLKYYRWPTLVAFLERKVYRLPGGIQHIWTAVAAAFDVRLNTSISRIERSDVVRITANSTIEDFDALIVASPLDDALLYLDASADERELFSNITYVDYCTIACSVKGIPDGDGYIPKNFSPSRAGTPVFWHHRHADTNVYTFYALADGKQTDGDIVDRMTDLIGKMNGTVETLHSVTHWKYFPHLSPDVMKSGCIDRIESLQGKNHTFYVGELLNFSTVGHTAEYADALVERMF